jgi:hypothetical protein
MRTLADGHDDASKSPTTYSENRPDEAPSDWQLRHDGTYRISDRWWAAQPLRAARRLLWSARLDHLPDWVNPFEPVTSGRV